MSKTKELLLKKYKPELVQQPVQQQPQPQDVQKAALPAISNYNSVDEWLGGVVPMVSHWPVDLAKAVLKDMITQHYAGSANK